MGWFKKKPKHCKYTWAASITCRRKENIHRITHECGLEPDHNSRHKCPCGVIKEE